MKKALVASILGLAGSIATTYGQGIIQFNNYSSAVYNPVVYGAGSGQTVGSNVNNPAVEVALFYALGTYSSTASFLASASQVATTFIDPAVNASGTYGSGPGGFYDSSASVSLAGWTSAATATFLVEGWLGSSYANASLNGQTALWTEVADTGLSSTLTGYGIVPSSVGAAGTFLSGPPTLTLTPTPEPTTLALAGLGGLASLVAFRRKQS
jgi:hypothetical protein